jgi:adenosylcobinamide-phosphate synthase
MVVEKPFIGDNDRILTTADMQRAVRVNRMAEVLAVTLVSLRFLC